MDTGIAAAIIIGVLFTGVITIIRTFLQYKLKRKIIDLGKFDDKAIDILGGQEDGRFASLKWGLVIFFGGLGLVLLNFIPYEADSPFPYGVEAVFISAGFLIYYLFVRKGLEKN